jgi:DNA-binding XRE family transcriptional regulator
MGAYSNRFPGFGPAHWTDKDHYVRKRERVPTDPPLPEWVLPRRQQLGRHIARQRHAAGLTVDAVAERTGLNRKTVMHIESARRNPTLATLLLIADALGTSVGRMLLLDDGPAADTGAAGGGTA